jgi:hypothetical protein
MLFLTAQIFTGPILLSNREFVAGLKVGVAMEMQRILDTLLPSFGSA